VDFKEETAFEQACQMVEMALEAYKERDRSKVAVPSHKNKVIAGFSVEALLDVFRAVNPDNPIQVLTGWDPGRGAQRGGPLLRLQQPKDSPGQEPSDHF